MESLDGAVRGGRGVRAKATTVFLTRKGPKVRYLTHRIQHDERGSTKGEDGSTEG